MRQMPLMWSSSYDASLFCRETLTTTSAAAVDFGAANATPIASRIRSRNVFRPWIITADDDDPGMKGTIFVPARKTECRRMASTPRLALSRSYLAARDVSSTTFDARTRGQISVGKPSRKRVSTQ